MNCILLFIIFFESLSFPHISSRSILIKPPLLHFPFVTPSIFLYYHAINHLPTVISLTIVAATVIETYLNDKGYNFVQVIVVSKLWSVGVWFLWATPFFALRYRRDKRFFNARIPSAPCAPVSPNEAA